MNYSLANTIRSVSLERRANRRSARKMSSSLFLLFIQVRMMSNSPKLRWCLCLYFDASFTWGLSVYSSMQLKDRRTLFRWEPNLVSIVTHTRLHIATNAELEMMLCTCTDHLASLPIIDIRRALQRESQRRLTHFLTVRACRDRMSTIDTSL